MITVLALKNSSFRSGLVKQITKPPNWMVAFPCGVLSE